MYTLTRRCWAWLTASKPRFSFACALLVVGLLLWARLILVSNMPRTAVADDEETATAPERESSSDKADGQSAQEGAPDGPKAEPRVTPR